MNAWLIYEKSNVERNRFFIDRWMEATQKQGIRLHLIFLEDILFGVCGNQLLLKAKAVEALPDFAVMRAQAPLLSAQFEKLNIPVFNNADVALCCNDKQRTHQRLCGLVPMMDSAFISGTDSQSPFPYPVVVKATHGCGGRQVRLCHDERAFHEALLAFAPDSAVVQPLCDSPGQDLRCYVLGNRILKSFRRFSNEDFRSNVGLGGGSEPFPLDHETEKQVEILLTQFRFGLVGLDFIKHEGRWIFNEIEDAVGTRMLYMHNNRDIVSDYLSFILNSL